VKDKEMKNIWGFQQLTIDKLLPGCFRLWYHTLGVALTLRIPQPFIY
jgi:hypothetical protein